MCLVTTALLCEAYSQDRYATFLGLHACSGFDSSRFARLGKLTVLSTLHKHQQLLEIFVLRGVPTGDGEDDCCR